MKVIIDNDKFDNFQERVLTEIIRGIQRTLKEKEVPEKDIYDITGDLAFNICAILDGSAVMKEGGEDVIPYLTFLKEREDKETLLASESGSYLHEISFGFIDEIFDEDDEDE